METRDSRGNTSLAEYNDSFDNPEEEDDVPLDELDEDELYARGSTKKED